MKVEISVPELVETFKEIQKQPEKLFEMIRLDIRETVGQYLTSLMNAELTDFLGREPYERARGEVNHRNGNYERHFTLKSIGEVGVNVPRDRKGAFKTCVIPRSKQYEEAIRQDRKHDVFDRHQHAQSFDDVQKAPWSTDLTRRGEQRK